MTSVNGLHTRGKVERLECCEQSFVQKTNARYLASDVESTSYSLTFSFCQA